MIQNSRTLIKQQLRQLLGMFRLATPAEFLWRSLTPKGRHINRNIKLHHGRMVGMYRQFLKHGDLCFDVGANIGTRVDVFLRLGARVIAVEPQQQCVDHMRAKYRLYKNVTIEPVGLDEAPGEHEFLISSHSLTSSMSKEWVERIGKRGGKYAQHRWEKATMVPVTTLDILIQHYGMPAFCKIDVEGFEYQVLKGLSQPIRALSLEYTPEYIQPAVECVKRLTALGNYEFNYAVEETMTFELSSWVSAREMCGTLDQLQSRKISGDVYARLIGSGYSETNR